jgi:putative acetyltransferase
MSDSILFYYKDLAIRPWAPPDRPPVAELIATILAEYGLGWEPQGADRDVLDIETCYTAIGGEFWVIERDLQVVGTAAYYPVARAPRAVEIRKMYFLPAIRGQGLGRFLLAQLEAKIAAKAFAKSGSKPPAFSKPPFSFTKPAVIQWRRALKPSDAIVYIANGFDFFLQTALIFPHGLTNLQSHSILIKASRGYSAVGSALQWH